MSAGSSNLSSCVRTTTAVWWSGSTCANASCGHSTISSSADGMRSRVANFARASATMELPAEELRAAAHRLGGVDGAVDEEARRRAVATRRRPSSRRRARATGCDHGGSARRNCATARRARRRPARRPRARAPSSRPRRRRCREDDAALLRRAELQQSRESRLTRRSTKTSISPPQGSPTAQASSSLIP